MITISFEGRTYQFPADITDDEIREILNSVSGFENDEELLDKLRQHEGMKPFVYKDTEGNPTIGIGFNLNRAGAGKVLKEVLGFSSKKVKAVKAGDLPLSVNQMNRLLKHDVITAREEATSLFESFSSQPRKIQEVLINMTFNLGKSKLRRFKKFIKAIDERDYNQAAFEMLNNKNKDGTVSPTPWAKQVKGRATELASIVQDFGQAPTAGGKELVDFGEPFVPQEIVELSDVDFPSGLSRRELREQDLELRAIPETPEEEKGRQEALRERLSIGEFADVGRMAPGFFQRDNGSFFEVTAKGGVIEHGS